MIGAFIKRLAIWLLLTLPVGVAAGALFSAFVPEDADLDRFTSAVNGAWVGAGLASIGAWSAAATTTVMRGTLRQAGGSEFLTGAVISYGLVIVGLLLLEYGVG